MVTGASPVVVTLAICFVPCFCAFSGSLLFKVAQSVEPMGCVVALSSDRL